MTLEELASLPLGLLFVSLLFVIITIGILFVREVESKRGEPLSSHFQETR